MRWGLGPGPWAERACWLGWAVRDGQPWALGPGSMAQLLGSLTSRSWAWLGPLCSSEAPGGTALLSAKERVWLGPWAVNDRDIVLQSRRDAETPWLTVGSGCGVPSEGASRASSQSTLPPPSQWPSRCQFMGEGAEARDPFQGPPLGSGSCRSRVPAVASGPASPRTLGAARTCVGHRVFPRVPPTWQMIKINRTRCTRRGRGPGPGWGSACCALPLRGPLGWWGGCCRLLGVCGAPSPAAPPGLPLPRSPADPSPLGWKRGGPSTARAASASV